MRKNSHRDGSRKEDILWFCSGWIARYVLSTGYATSVSRLLIPTCRGVCGALPQRQRIRLFTLQWSVYQFFVDIAVVSADGESANGQSVSIEAD